MLYKYANERGIAAKLVGKLIVATTQAEMGKLESIQRNAAQNDVNDLV